ncbi:hypothetical protein BH10PSE19_BH10PSE19_17460 [soil metagenome]
MFKSSSSFFVSKDNPTSTGTELATYSFCIAKTSEEKKPSVESYQTAARNGDGKAAYDLGVCYGTGQGVLRDDKRAVEWFHLAETDRSIAPEAKFALGIHLVVGRGIAKSETLATMKFVEAASAGHAKAQLWLGKQYQEGRGATKSLDAAAACFELAAAQGLASAQFELGRCYAWGEGKPIEYSKANSLLRTASAQGHSGAIQLLARFEVDPAYRRHFPVPEPTARTGDESSSKTSNSEPHLASVITASPMTI